VKNQIKKSILHQQPTCIQILAFEMIRVLQWRNKQKSIKRQHLRKQKELTDRKYVNAKKA